MKQKYPQLKREFFLFDGDLSSDLYLKSGDMFLLWSFFF